MSEAWLDKLYANFPDLPDAVASFTNSDIFDWPDDLATAVYANTCETISEYDFSDKLTVASIIYGRNEVHFNFYYATTVKEHSSEGYRIILEFRFTPNEPIKFDQAHLSHGHKNKCYWKEPIGGVMGNNQFKEHTKVYPEINSIIHSLNRIYPRAEDLKNAIFTKYPEGTRRAHHIFPAVDHCRINEVFVGNGEVTYYIILTTTGSRDDMWSSVINYKFDPKEKILFDQPTSYRHSMIIGC